jgi:hypothetical protein
MPIQSSQILMFTEKGFVAGFARCGLLTLLTTPFMLTALRC